MKIVHYLFLPDKEISGSVKYVNLLLRGLLEEDERIEIKLVVEEDPLRDDKYFEKVLDKKVEIFKLPGLGFRSWQFPLVSKENTLFYLSNLLFLQATVLPTMPEIIHFHHLVFPTFFGIFGAYIAEIPSIVTSHGTGIDEILVNRDITERYPKLSGWIGSTLEMASKIIVMSKFMRKKLLEVYPELKGKVEVIYPAVDVEFFKPSEASLELRKRYGKFVLYYGRLSKRKGVLKIIELAKIMEDTNFVVIGVPQEEEVMEALKDANRALKNFHFVGYVAHKDVPRYVASASLVLVPSQWDEPFPHTAIEPLACGTPVLVSDRGGLPEIPRSKGIEIDSFEDLNLTAEKVKELVELSEDEKIRKKLRELAISGFSHRAMARRYLKIYEEVLR